MDDFGARLRQAREQRGISLRQIAASTKISAAALEALERNDISKLPGGIFSRAFVRSYAVEVGLNPEETVREFLDRFHGEPAPAASAAISERESSFESRQRAASVVLSAALVVVVIGSTVVYVMMRSRAAASPHGAPAPPAPAPLAPAPPEVQPAILPAAADPPASAAGIQAVMTLDIHPTGRCWI